jgi:hypothetical protein
MRSIRDLMKRLAPCCTFGLLASFLNAQVTIQNPQHLAIPEQRVQVLHYIVCRAVAEELHSERAKCRSTRPHVLER